MGAGGVWAGPYLQPQPCSPREGSSCSPALEPCPSLARVGEWWPVFTACPAARCLMPCPAVRCGRTSTLLSLPASPPGLGLCFVEPPRPSHSRQPERHSPGCQGHLSDWQRRKATSIREPDNAAGIHCRWMSTLRPRRHVPVLATKQVSCTCAEGGPPAPRCQHGRMPGCVCFTHVSMASQGLQADSRPSPGLLVSP